ncbi:DNA polymerase Y family protein [Martelella alba]|uniref:DNA-directed DNA polymerase n=1 Tax=Martelella alba TaxID=2590451 RepID=A0A506UFV4_9HYPH|nr:DNA polymerase Y family protein [Martelella alba]TPW32211.1 DNA polymerase Y family protein [Martelella alba]
MKRRIVSIWFPRLPSDRALRRRPIEGAFAVTLHEGNHDRLHCLNQAAETLGLERGMGLADARAYVPDLITHPADRHGDARFLALLARWATRYTPFAGLDGDDGLILDMTGALHLFGGEEAMLGDLKARLARAGLSARLGLADTRGAAAALARFAPGIAAEGETATAIAKLPVAALGIAPQTATTLKRLGLDTIADLAALPRASLARRFGMELLERLDQATGARGETISPLAEPPHYGVRMNLPEPIGLKADVTAVLERLLARLCDRLKTREAGARRLVLTLSRVDQSDTIAELRLARPMRDAIRISRLFERSLDKIDAGFGIERARLEAIDVEDLPAEQIDVRGTVKGEALDDLVTRLGTRIGLDNIQRFQPAESHIPERSFFMAPAAWSKPEGQWAAPRPRPLTLFTPEPLLSDQAAQSRNPPARFTWRRIGLHTARAEGPERIAPEWWFDDPDWRSGLRDYWRVETREGFRLFMFHTPQAPNWFVQGQFA